MPLGFFAGNSSSKPQPLPSGDSGGKEKREKKDVIDKDGRGTVLKLGKTSVTIDRKLAEGGFAIVYLATDKQNRQYALKRQFINEDSKQVDACRREYQIVNSLKGHKNIVCYADHYLGKNKTGIYDYMLLTAYYKTSVLQLMNDRLALGRGLTTNEILSIFCDMCEAVARLHHSQTPVIHRDLKVENILIDERNRAGPPIYVLCDFGSATTKVLSSDNYPVHLIQEEIDKYTTLSYRAPEMIDVYGGKPIGTKADIWAMGIMLFKLCYFSLPFGESAMAIQNGTFTFPSHPHYPDPIKAIIKCLLDADIDRRPSIYHCAALSFQAVDKPCPVHNVFNSRKPSLSLAIQSLRSGGRLSIYQANDEEESQVDQGPATFDLVAESSKESPIVSLSDMTSTTTCDPQTTSVNPRLRPKPNTSVPILPIIPPSPSSKVSSGQSHMRSLNSTSEPEIPGFGRIPNDNLKDCTASMDEPPLSCPLMKPSDLGFTDLEDALPRDRAQTEASALKQGNQNTLDHIMFKGTATEIPARSVISLPSTVVVQMHRKNASDTSQIIKSAFKPYSQTAVVSPQVVSVSSSNLYDSKKISEDLTEKSSGEHGSWNPFLAAPFGSGSNMDDNHFGQCFDELRRNTVSWEASGSTQTIPCPSSQYEIDRISIDSRDPFGAAPFDPPLRLDVNNSTVEDSIPGRDIDADSVGSAGDLRHRMQNDDDSEQDEQRMKARRRYSYEHIDGVGDDASSDSRGRTDQDSTDDLSKNEESSHDDDNESSQHTDVAGSDDGVGNRPLLEDDELEQDDEDVIHGFHTIRKFDSSGQLFINPYSKCTNPFLNNTDDTPKMSPAQENCSNYVPHVRIPYNWMDSVNHETIDGRWLDHRRDTLFEKPSLPVIAPLNSTYAPATLPRQATPLAAAPKPIIKPFTQNVKSFNIDPNVSMPKSQQTRDITVSVKPMVGRLIQVAPLPPSKPPSALNMIIAQPTVSSSLKGSSVSTIVNKESVENNKTSAVVVKQSGPSFIEGPKTPKSKKSKDKERKRMDSGTSGSELETDGSEAEMCTSTSSDKANSSKKKRKAGTFSLRGSNPSFAPTDLKLPSPSTTGVKKVSGKRSTISSSARKGSTGALNASFVNSSFQAEEIESPPSQRAILRL